MKYTGLLAARLAAMAALAGAVEVVYVTDLAIFTELAPCAASAVGNILQSQTYTNCPEAVTDLQACICTKNNNFASISKAVSSSVSYKCGGTASEDQASAATVLSAYCSQDNLPSFPKPSFSVSQYITDLAAIGDLAPCASSALAYAVQSMSYSYCPEDANLLAPCVCSKNQNSLKVSQMINTNVKSSCSSHSADITSAQAMFAAYCGLPAGVSSFPQPSDPPGDVSYYITALPQYSSLAPCAQSGVSYALFAQTWDFCPKGPKALASCACIKDGLYLGVSSTLTSNIKWNCGSTASEDVSSGLAVLDYFCSAAKAEVTAGGVTESISQTYGTAKSGSGSGASPKETGKSGSNGTSGGKSSSATASAGGSGGSSDDSSSSSSRTPIIAGAVVGVVAGLALIGTLTFCVMRHVRKKRAAAEITPFQPAYAGAGPGPDGGLGDVGKPELAGVALAVPPSGMPPSPSPSAQKQNAWARADDVSPMSGNNSAFPPGSPHTPAPAYPHGAYTPPAPELHGQPVHEFPAQIVYQADSQPVQPQRAELQGMGWQSVLLKLQG